MIVLLILLVTFDQITKHFALRLQFENSIVVIKNVFALTFVKNHGAAFGILQKQRWLFILIASVAIFIITRYIIMMPKDSSSVLKKLSMILICSGALGNLIDRLINGYVVDFLELSFINFPVFNFADVYLTIGVALLILSSCLRK